MRNRRGGTVERAGGSGGGFISDRPAAEIKLIELHTLHLCHGLLSALMILVVSEKRGRFVIAIV